MTRTEFLSILRGKIAGRMDQTEVEAQLKYYSDYIDSLISQGKTEEEAVEELGDPLLIAKTLGNAVKGGYLDSNYQYDGKSSAENSSGSKTYNGSSYSYESYERASGNADYRENSKAAGFKEKVNDFKNSSRFQLFKANAKTIIGLIVALIIAIGLIVLFFVSCFSVGGCIIGGLFPMLAVIIILGLLFSVFRNR